MAVVKINRKIFGGYYAFYDISHAVTGTLSFNDRTTININSPALQGTGDYKLYTYGSLSIGAGYNNSIRRVLHIIPGNANYEGYATINGNAVYAKIYDTSNIIKDHAQTVDNGTLTIAGPTEIELDASLFNAAGKYALFDYRLGEFAGNLSDITVTMSGSTSLTPSAPYIEGPYIVTTLS